MVTQYVKAYVKRSGIQTKIEVMQGDSGRELKCQIMDMTIPEECTARIYCRKPSGKEVYNDCTVIKNTVVVKLTTQMIAEVGMTPCQVELSKNGEKVTTFTFLLSVKKSLVSENTIESKDEFTALEKALNDARASAYQAVSEYVEEHGVEVPAEKIESAVGNYFYRNPVEDGKSAYEIWLAAGNEGDEEDFLAAMKGEKGDRGETGATGAKGDPGAAGTAGKDGSDATVTTDNIAAALGYTPADETKVSQLSKEITELKTMGGLTIPIVDCVDEMVDTGKQYILKSAGTIWTYKEITYEKENVVRDEVTGTYERGRFSSSGGTNAGDVLTHTITPFVDLTKSEYKGKTIQIHLEGNKYAASEMEAYVMTSLFDFEKNNILPRAYTTPVSGGLITAITNGSLEISSEKKAILSLEIPCYEKATGKEVGYMRFCGLGTVDGTVYITYVDKQTVTESKWIDTGVSYGGNSVDKEILEKISVLNNEGEDVTSIQLLPSPVLNFYNSDAYLDDDYTVSHLSKITYPCRADIPVPFAVKWNYREDAMRTMVAIDRKEIGTLNAYTMKIYEATGLSKYPIYNLMPSTTYYYKVIHILHDGSIVEAKSGKFVTATEPWRLLYIEGTQNARDLGGWTGLNGKKVKYGKIFRGAALSDSSFPGLIITGSGRLALAELNIQAELNLGAADNFSEIAQNCEYKKVYYTNYASAITDESYRTMFKELLEWIVGCLNGSKPIYMHCQGGCDRTGTLSFLLLGLLGVSESDLAKEYELSSFSSIGFGRLRTTTKAVDTYDYVGMVAALKTYSGSTITDKFYDFAVTGCGVAADTIVKIRNMMLE